jgi:hypothetical protein
MERGVMEPDLEADCLVAADYLEEHGFPLPATVLRNVVRECRKERLTECLAPASWLPPVSSCLLTHAVFPLHGPLHHDPARQARYSILAGITRVSE